MKILVVGPAWIGDMVMAHSLIRTLRQQHEDAEIDVLAPDWTRPILERMPGVNQALDMPAGHGELKLGLRRRLGKSLAKAGYDQAIVLPNSFKSALVPWFADVPIRTGWRGEARSWLLNDCRKLDKSRYPLMVQRFTALAWPDGHLPDSVPLPEPALKVEPGNVLAARKRFALENDRPVIICCPGAEFGMSKKWPPQHFSTLANELISSGNQVWLMGSANDRRDCETITAYLGDETRQYCHNLAGETGLAEAIDLMSTADAVVSNDSGLMHVAAALGKSMVAIYGSTSPAFTPPLCRAARVVSLKLDCSPCFKRECPLEHHNCMVNLDPGQILGELTGAANIRVK